METIESKNGGMKWKVIERDEDGYYRVECPDCGYQLEFSKAKIREAETCPKCEPQPAALKTDDNGNCINVCEIGFVEFIYDYRDKNQVSERAAVRAFFNAAEAHLPSDDPFLDGFSEESLRAELRRRTGKKKDKNKVGANRPEKKKTDKVKRYTVKATPESVSKFLGKYLPDYTLVPIAEAAT